MKNVKKSNAKNVKKVIEILSLNELLQIRGGDNQGITITKEGDID